MTTIDKVKQIVESIQDDDSLPSFYPGYWFDDAQNLTESNMDPLLQGTLYPQVFLNVDFFEDVDTETSWVKPDPLTLFIIDRVDEKNLSVYEQHLQVFPAYRVIEENLIAAFKRKKCRTIPERRKEYFFNKKIKNRVNNDIYVIQMILTDFKYNKNCEL